MKIRKSLQTPRVTGVKVYEMTSDPNDIMIDVSFSYYGDAELSVCINKLEAGIKDISFEGSIRILLKLTKKATFIGAIEISFLNNPTFDFNLTTALAAIDMFSTGDLLRSFISDQISQRMIYPDKVFIKIKDHKERQREKDAKAANKINHGTVEGVIRIQVKNLCKLEGLNGKKVRATINLEGQTAESPEFVIKDEKADANITSDMIRFSRDDSNLLVVLILEDGESFHKRVEFSALDTEGSFNKKLTLCPSGLIDLSMSWFELSIEKDDLMLESKQGSALLIIFIDSTKNFPKQHPDIYVKVEVAQQCQDTISYETNSSIKKYFNVILSNPENETLKVSLIDDSTSKLLGSFNYKLSDLISKKRMKEKLQDFPLNSIERDCAGEIVMKMKLRALKRFEKKDSSD